MTPLVHLIDRCSPSTDHLENEVKKQNSPSLYHHHAAVKGSSSEASFFW
ncbi:10803_t:CDS:2 [Acaulospora colombiana]|uniref:10803_t:CDS:1 n=1 Tax=Acaulospora colombiana TaxID=27376 RepID=A0ACA9KVD1_9GLOM|nr:10803_t:CDS:2 [Acaulospora colombiana]